MEPEQNNCVKCGMAGEGYKCDMCGAEAEHHDAGHGCGSEHCMTKCSGCKEAESKCACPVQA